MEKKLRMTPEQVLEQAKLSVRFAKNACPDVEFSPEDGCRSDLDFLCRVLEAVIKEGATTINIPDTVGYAVPQQFGEFIRQAAREDSELGQGGLVRALPQRPRHGGGQLARRGADRRRAPDRVHHQRPGRARRQHLARGGGDGRAHARGFLRSATRESIPRTSCPTSRLVSQITGFVVQPNKAVVGANAFAHASGIHQDGVLKARNTYEIMRAEDVGWSTNKIVLGKLSGRNAFKQRLKELGIELDERGRATTRRSSASRTSPTRRPTSSTRTCRRWWRRRRASPSDEHWKLVTMNQASGMGETAVRQDHADRSRQREERPNRRATARSTPPSRRSRAWRRAARSCCSTR